MKNGGYVWVPGWERYQHRDATRRGQMPWMKLYTDLLGDDAFVELDATDRCLYIGILLLTCRHGNGRVKADSRWLMGQLSLPYSGRYRGLERLAEAGLVHVSASKGASHLASDPASTMLAQTGEEEDKMVHRPYIGEEPPPARDNGAQTERPARFNRGLSGDQIRRLPQVKEVP